MLLTQLGQELRGIEVPGQDDLRGNVALEGSGQLIDDGLGVDLIGERLRFEKRLELDGDPLPNPLELALRFLAIEVALDLPFGNVDQIGADGLPRLLQVRLEEEVGQAGSQLDDEGLGDGHPIPFGEINEYPVSRLVYPDSTLTAAASRQPFPVIGHPSLQIRESFRDRQEGCDDSCQPQKYRKFIPTGVIFRQASVMPRRTGGKIKLAGVL